MGFFYTPLPLWVAVGGWIVTAGLLALALVQNPFRRLQDGTLQHVWLGDHRRNYRAVGVQRLVRRRSRHPSARRHADGHALRLAARADRRWPPRHALAAVVLDASWPRYRITFLLFGALPVGISTLAPARKSRVAAAQSLHVHHRPRLHRGRDRRRRRVRLRWSCSRSRLAGGPVVVPAGFMLGVAAT